jgi:hypothetical protein
VPIPVVPQPLSHIVPCSTEPDLNNHDQRFGFHLPPSVDRPQVCKTGFTNPPSNSPVTMEVSRIAPGTETSGSRVPLDPVLFAENQFQSSFRPPPVVHHSSSLQVPQRQYCLPFPPDRDPTPLPPGQHPFAGKKPKGQATGPDISMSDSDTSEDDGDEKVDESGGEYEQDGSDLGSDSGSDLGSDLGSDSGSDSSNDEYEQVPLSHLVTQVYNGSLVSGQDQDSNDTHDTHDFYDANNHGQRNPNNSNELGGNGYQDLGAEYTLREPSLGAGHFCETSSSLILSLQHPALISLHLKMSDLLKNSYAVLVSTQ